MNPVTSLRRPRRLALAVLAVVGLAVAACGGAAATASPVASAAAAGGAVSTAPVELAGTNWLLIRYLSSDGALFTVPAAITPKASFTADTMSGNAGCNTFSGGYALTGQDLKLDPMAATMMACEEPIASVEKAYLAALNVVDKAALLDNGNLQLWDSKGKTTLVFRKGN
jgi:heat shock protein HslJ